MKKEYVIINGTGRSGKDTFIELVSKYYKVKSFSSVDKVKEIAKIAGWTGAKEEKDRKFLSDLKRLLTEYNQLPQRDMLEKINEFQQSDEQIMFIQIREPEEIQKAVDLTNAKTLLIRRPEVSLITSNYSDASVENYDYDMIIENTTLEELEEQAKNFMGTLQSKVYQKKCE